MCSKFKHTFKTRTRTKNFHLKRVCSFIILWQKVKEKKKASPVISEERGKYSEKMSATFSVSFTMCYVTMCLSVCILRCSTCPGPAGPETTLGGGAEQAGGRERQAGSWGGDDGEGAAGTGTTTQTQRRYQYEGEHYLVMLGLLHSGKWIIGVILVICEVGLMEKDCVIETESWPCLVQVTHLVGFPIYSMVRILVWEKCIVLRAVQI